MPRAAASQPPAGVKWGRRWTVNLATCSLALTAVLIVLDPDGLSVLFSRSPGRCVLRPGPLASPTVAATASVGCSTVKFFAGGGCFGIGPLMSAHCVVLQPVLNARGAAWLSGCFLCPRPRRIRAQASLRPRPLFGKHKLEAVKPWPNRGATGHGRCHSSQGDSSFFSSAICRKFRGPVRCRRRATARSSVLARSRRGGWRLVQRQPPRGPGRPCAPVALAGCPASPGRLARLWRSDSGGVLV